MHSPWNSLKAMSKNIKKDMMKFGLSFQNFFQKREFRRDNLHPIRISEAKGQFWRSFATQASDSQKMVGVHGGYYGDQCR